MGMLEPRQSARGAVSPICGHGAGGNGCPSPSQIGPTAVLSRLPLSEPAGHYVRGSWARVSRRWRAAHLLPFLARRFSRDSSPAPPAGFGARFSMAETWDGTLDTGDAQRNKIYPFSMVIISLEIDGVLPSAVFHGYYLLFFCPLPPPRRLA